VSRCAEADEAFLLRAWTFSLTDVYILPTGFLDSSAYVGAEMTQSKGRAGGIQGKARKMRCVWWVAGGGGRSRDILALADDGFSHVSRSIDTYKAAG
jgi:hypothetical protein